MPLSSSTSSHTPGHYCSPTISSCRAAITSFCPGSFFPLPFAPSLCFPLLCSSQATLFPLALTPHRLGLSPHSQCPITFTTLISPFLCPSSCPRPTAAHSHLPQRERSSSSQLNQLRYHRNAFGKTHTENSLYPRKKPHQKGARKPEQRG